MLQQTNISLLYILMRCNNIVDLVEKFNMIVDVYDNCFELCFDYKDTQAQTDRYIQTPTPTPTPTYPPTATPTRSHFSV